MAEINSIQIIFMFFLMMAAVMFEGHSCPPYQREALLHFKSLLHANNTFPPDYYLLDGFKSWESSASDCCNWDLIGCDSSRHVTRFDNLNQSPRLTTKPYVSSHVLSPLFHIRTLTHLLINANGFYGPFPAAGISNLTNLVSLDMSANKFSGTIPPDFLPPKHLIFFILDSNLIEGKLSSNLFRLSYLNELQLQNNFIHGEIPSEIGNLTRLQWLDLSNNRLSGPILPSMFGFRELKGLYLQHNSLSMETPSEISNLTGIPYVRLSGNNLSGTIPPSTNNITQLLVLDLEDNFLTGEIPSWLFDSRTLIELRLGGNKLFLKNSSMGPKSKLHSLSLRSCNISGDFPVWLSNQTELYELDLSDNGFTGTFPDWLIKISPNLYSLFFSNNRLSGQILPLLFNSSLIKKLDLSMNYFSGHLPDNASQYERLNTLMLSSNDFSGPIPKSLSVAPLAALDLSNNRFSGSELPSFEYLYTLDLSFNEFSGQIPTNFSENLIVLVLSKNRFSGNFPRKLASLLNLKCLDLHDNNLTGEIPSSLFEISSLQILNLRNNSFEGPIPINLSNLTLLQILDLSDNNLSGNIPATVGNLSGMIGIHQDLSYGAISDIKEWTTEVQINYPDLEVIWKALRRNLPNRHLGMYTLLDISNNRLSGEIPVTLGALKNLKLLNISHNVLSGTIPSNIGGLENLESLDMSYNRISGEIPDTLGKLLQLGELELRNNNLTGQIPRGPQMDRLNNPEYYAGNNGLCGMQIQVSCDKESEYPNKEADKERDEKMWGFSWMMAGIGFPSGYLSTVLVLYVVGFFHPVPNRRRRYRARRRVRL